MKKCCYFLVMLLCLQACSKDAAVSPTNSSTGGTGQGGSLARFTIARDHLYVVDGSRLYTYTLASSAHPQLSSTVNAGFNIETIYSYEDKLFIGSQNAMYIYSIADAGQPALLGEASHVRACDPVVANDSLAYVTVRSGSTCGGTLNALLVYDVRNVLNPVLRNTVLLASPWGLGLKGNRLYVCDGASGLVVYDITNPVYPREIRTLTDEVYYDVIATSDLLIAMVQGGTALYSYGTGDSLTRMAKIAK